MPEKIDSLARKRAVRLGFDYHQETRRERLRSKQSLPRWRCLRDLTDVSPWSLANIEGSYTNKAQMMASRVKNPTTRSRATSRMSP